MKFRRTLLAFLLCTLVTLSISCSDDSPSGPDTNPDRVSKEIDPDGGELMSADGDLTLTVPEGALSSTQTITIEPLNPDDLTPPFDEFEDIGGAYELGPDGLNFNEPIAVTYDIGNDPFSEDGSIEISSSALLTQDEENTPVALSRLTKYPDPETGLTRISGELTHFSPVIHIEKRDVLLTISGIPDNFPAHEIFTAEVVVNASAEEADDLKIRYVTYEDQSGFPVELVIPENNPQVLPQDGEIYSGSIPYTCTEPGVGFYKPTVSFSYTEDPLHEDYFIVTSYFLNKPSFTLEGEEEEEKRFPVTCTQPVEPQFSVDVTTNCLPPEVTESGDPLLQVGLLVEFEEHSMGWVEVQENTPDDETNVYKDDIKKAGSGSSSDVSGFVDMRVDMLPERPAGIYAYTVKAFTESDDPIWPSEGIEDQIDISQKDVDDCQESSD